MARPSLRKLLWSVAISVAVAALTTVVTFISFYLLYPVTGVEVRGARMFPESEVWDALPEHASLLSLNAGTLERRVESNPWVKGAEVIKDWDSGIVTVEVEERKPVLNGDLGSRRVVLAADGKELPGLGGADLTQVALDEVQLEGIVKVGEVLEENGVVLGSIDSVDEAGVEASIEDQRVRFAGDVGEGQARALGDLMKKHSESPYFDLRSPERVVVGVESSGG